MQLDENRKFTDHRDFSSTQERVSNRRSQNRRRVLILEPHADGHHGTYLSWISEGLVSRDFAVAVTTLPRTLDHQALRAVRCLKKEHRLELLSLTGPHNDAVDGHMTLVGRELRYWKLFRRWYRSISPGFKPDIVLLPYVDYCLYAIGLLGSPFGDTQWAGLTMRPSFHYRAIGINAPIPRFASLKRQLFFRLLRQSTLRTLFTIDDSLLAYLRTKSCVKKLHLLPDPAPISERLSKIEARRALGLKTSHALVLVYGAISARKGVFELLTALQDPTFPVDVDVMLAGKISNEVKRLIDSPWVVAIERKKRLHVIDRFLGEREEAAAFSAADMVWLGYKAHYGASGVLVQAGRMRLPVIACEMGVIGWQTGRYGLGVVVSPDDTPSVVAAVRRLAEDRQFAEACGVNGCRLFSQHCQETASDLLAAAL